MKTIKTNIGTVGYVETNDTWENSMKQIPKGYRAVEDYEALYLARKQKSKLEKMLEKIEDWYWCKNDHLCFWPVGRVFRFIIYHSWATRGVLVIKKGEGLK